eukprot:Colp12_sorted_trinity150504_noHs@28684
MANITTNKEGATLQGTAGCAQEGATLGVDLLLVGGEGVLGLGKHSQVLLDARSQLGIGLLPEAKPDVEDLLSDTGAGEGGSHTLGKALLAGLVERPVTCTSLSEVVSLFDHVALLLAIEGLVALGVGGSLPHVLSNRAWEVVDLASRGPRLLEVHGAVKMAIVERALRAVDGEHLVVDTQAVGLSVHVREQPGLQHLLIRGGNARHHSAGGESNLLVLEELGAHVLVEDHLAHLNHGEQGLGPLLSGVEGIEVELADVVALGDGLHVHGPLGELTTRDGLVEISGVEAEVLLGSLSVIVNALHTLFALEVVTHKGDVVGTVDPLEGVHTPAVKSTVRCGDADVIHEPGEHVSGLRVVGEVVIDAPPFLNTSDRVGLQRADHLGETDAVTDEEDREVKTDDVIVALLSVELDSKTSRVTKVFR